MKILSTRVAHQGWLKLIVATVLTDHGETLEREFIAPRPAAAVLPYDAARGVALLVLQPRAPVIHGGGPPLLLEAAAGQIDDGETAAQAIRREAMEELGLRLQTLEPVADTWTSPGPSAERLTLFLAPYVAADRVGAGGGLESEHESLTVQETPLQDLWSQAQTGAIADLKTLTLLFALATRRPDLLRPN
jgi:nudix-type nucleoside diphosphatase (YffH/AdpP family)